MKSKLSSEEKLRGLEQAIRLLGKEHVLEHIEMWERLDPEFGELDLRFGYGGLMARKVLDLKVRELCVISGLVALNALPQLKTHMRAALRVGASEAEVKEAIIQMSAYCGVPYMNQAIGVYEEVVRNTSGS